MALKRRFNRRSLSIGKDPDALQTEGIGGDGYIRACNLHINDAELRTYDDVGDMDSRVLRVMASRAGSLRFSPAVKTTAVGRNIPSNSALAFPE